MSRAVRMNNELRYKTNRDYARLWTLLQETSVICIVDYMNCRDIAATIFYDNVAQVSARGITYVWAESYADFERRCQKINLEFIDVAVRGKKVFRCVKCEAIYLDTSVTVCDCAQDATEFRECMLIDPAT